MTHQWTPPQKIRTGGVGGGNGLLYALIGLVAVDQLRIRIQCRGSDPPLDSRTDTHSKDGHGPGGQPGDGPDVHHVLRPREQVRDGWHLPLHGREQRGRVRWRSRLMPDLGFSRVADMVGVTTKKRTP